MEKYIEIGGRLHSTATGNVTTGANEILDDELNKKQSQINSETLQHVESIDAALQELSPDQTQALALATDVNTLKAKSVRGDETQSLTDTEKEQAISNMGVTGVYDISGENPVSGHPKKYSTLPDALADVPVGRRKSGMSVKALMQFTQEMYHVEVTEGVTDLPTGYNEYELSEASSMTTGDYTYNELDTENFSAIPSTVGASVLYYIYDSQSSSYTTWLLTKSSDSTYAYKQYLYMQEYANTTAGNTAFLTASNWQGVDDKPTAGSQNLVKSGGVKEELALGAVYDVSAHNNGATFASLQALLSNANLNTLIPTSVRKGGMSIKFVQSSDNKYIQARCMAQNFTTDVTQWQGVDDEPTAGSENLVKSGGVYNETIKINGGEVDLSITGGTWGQYDIYTKYVDYDGVARTLYGVGVCSGAVYMIKAFSDVEHTQETASSGRGVSGTTENPVTCDVPAGTKVIGISYNIYPHELGDDWRVYYKVNGLLSRVEDLEGNVENLEEEVSTNADNADFNNAASLLPNVLDNCVARFENVLITNLGGLQQNNGYIVLRYDVTSVNNGSSYIYITAKGYPDYYPNNFALGRFIVGQNVQAVPIVNKKYLNGYKVLVPSGASYFDIAIFKSGGRVTVSLANAIELQNVTSYRELDRKLLVVKTELSIDWTDNAFCNGQIAVGNAIVIASNSNYRIGKIDVEAYRGQVIGLYCISDTDYNAFVDSVICDSNNIIIEKGLYMNEYIPMRIIYIDTDAKYLYISNNKLYPFVKVGVVDYSSLQKVEAYISIIRDKISSANNQWFGKKILWLGTSIPWGQDSSYGGRVDHPYPQQVCDALGATLIDSTHGGLAQMADYNQESSKWVPKAYGSTSLTIAECQAAYAAGLIDGDRSPYSYENTLLNKNADLYVFDVEPNNEDTGSAEVLALFDWYLWKYTDDSLFESHRDTYIGALIYEIDKLLTEKPDAIVLFVGEFINMKADNYNTPNSLRTLSISLCEKFHIHYIDLAKKLFYNGKNKNVWLNSDYVHPKKVTYDRIAKILIHELLLIA